jgi:hypothetical protein
MLILEVALKIQNALVDWKNVINNKRCYAWCEISILKFFTKLSPRVQAHYNDPLWGVTLYYFPRMCMFECIRYQTFKIFS